jgi:predicted RNA-binding protein with PIN domain
MDAHIYLAVERLEALLIGLRDQVAELKEQVETTRNELKVEIARSDAKQQRLAAEVGARLIEQRAYWLEVEHTSAPTDPRAYRSEG